MMWCALTAKEFVTIKNWKKTLLKRCLIVAVEEKSMSSALEGMVEKRTPEGFREELLDMRRSKADG